MTAELLRLDGVGVRLGGREVLRDVSLIVHPGEFTGLIGPNGAGKTTLLRIILGLQPVTTGSVPFITSAWKAQGVLLLAPRAWSR